MRGIDRVHCRRGVPIHELADRTHNEPRVIPHRQVATAGKHARLDAGYLTPETGRVTLRRQDAIELGRGEQYGTGDAVEVLQRKSFVGTGCLDRLAGHRTAHRGKRKIDCVRGGDELPVAHHVAHRQTPAPGSLHDVVDVSQAEARETQLAREEARESLRLAIAFAPTAGRRECDDRSRSTALGELEREGTTQRITHEMCTTNPQFVEMAFEMVGARGERQRAAEVKRRPAVVPGERRCDHFVASGELAQHRTPVMPGAGEPMHQHQRLAGAGAVQRRRDLAHAFRLLRIDTLGRVTDAPSGSRAIHALVAGTVQGVGFRAAVRSRARELGVMGWVRNVEDGAVVLHAEGPAAAIEALTAFLREGPPGTKVRDVTVEEVKVEGHEQFAVRGVSAGVFVVQEHAATAHHFDLRLEVDGAMRSWAVPKGPSLDPSVKRLAVQVPDHSIGYNAFEGRTDDGAVIVWDRGDYEQGGRVAWPEALERGHAVFVLHGEKLRGGFALQRTRPGPKSQWLLIKRRDEQALHGSDVVAEQPASVLGGQTLQELLADG
jgi:DNA ligase D-like protein (predicted 3'-phosphoesterase)